MDEGFSEARVLAEVTLLPDKVRIASGRRAVAMATGVIDRIYKHGQVQKQVLVVVTSGWSVMCFDHNLRKLWETNLQVCWLLSHFMYLSRDIANKSGSLTKRCLVYLLASVLFFFCLLIHINFSQEDFPHNVHHREISISISNYTLKHGDAGLIIIGGRMEIQPHVCLIFFSPSIVKT